MKKLFTVLLLLALTFTLIACKTEDPEEILIDDTPMDAVPADSEPVDHESVDAASELIGPLRMLSEQEVSALTYKIFSQIMDEVFGLSLDEDNGYMSGSGWNASVWDFTYGDVSFDMPYSMSKISFSSDPALDTHIITLDVFSYDSPDGPSAIESGFVGDYTDIYYIGEYLSIALTATPSADPAQEITFGEAELEQIKDIVTRIYAELSDAYPASSALDEQKLRDLNSYIMTEIMEEIFGFSYDIEDSGDNIDARFEIQSIRPVYDDTKYDVLFGKGRTEFYDNMDSTLIRLYIFSYEDSEAAMAIRQEYPEDEYNVIYHVEEHLAVLVYAYSDQGVKEELSIDEDELAKIGEIVFKHLSS